MKEDYYTLPLRFDKLLQKKMHTRCQLTDSLSQHLYVILTTRLEESRFDPDFGCTLWDFDFQMVPDPKENKYRWKKSIETSFEETIKKKETRLSRIKVKIEIEDFVEDYKVTRKATKKIRKRLWVRVDSIITSINEDFIYEKYLFIAPLSVD